MPASNRALRQGDNGFMLKRSNYLIVDHNMYVKHGALAVRLKSFDNNRT